MFLIIFDVVFFLNFSINGVAYEFIGSCSIKYYITFLLAKRLEITDNKYYVISIFNKYDEKILFRIWFLIKLIEDNLMNQDIMHVILDKVFFDQIKN